MKREAGSPGGDPVFAAKPDGQSLRLDGDVYLDTRPERGVPEIGAVQRGDLGEYPQRTA